MPRSLQVLGVVLSVPILRASCLSDYIRANKGILDLQPRRQKSSLRRLLNSSDLAFLKRIYIDHEYAPLLSFRPAGLTLDCGAYAGYTPSWFLAEFPRCRVIAIEPEESNFIRCFKPSQPPLHDAIVSPGRSALAVPDRPRKEFRPGAGKRHSSGNHSPLHRASRCFARCSPRRPGTLRQRIGKSFTTRCVDSFMT